MRLLLVLTLCFFQTAIYAKGFDFEANGIVLEEVTTQDAAKQPMPLSAIKRISNSIVIERQTTLQGVRTNYLYRVSSLGSIDAVADFYRNLLTEQGRIEFECKERNCGSSSFWANDVFENRNLVGRDSNQAYLVGQLDDGVHQGWLSVYLVENGRRIPYVYVSFIPAAPEDYIQDARRGVLVNDTAFSKDWVVALGDFLSKKKGSRVIVVGFSKVPGNDYAASLTRSKVYVERVTEKLKVDLSLKAERVEWKAMGLLGQRPLGFDGNEWAYMYLVD